MLQSFVSKSEIDTKKQERKEFLHEKLKKAQDEYESAKKKQELEESRGDSKWMLPAVEHRIYNESKHKKKKKKGKHKKKHKYKKIKHSPDSPDESSEEWEEAPQEESKQQISDTECDKKTCVQSLPTQREDWMMATSMFDVATSSTSFREQKTKKNQAEKREKDEKDRLAIHQSRELNPYWKDSGTGVPDENKIEMKTAAETTTYQRVGDGGRCWIQKSFERVKQQAIDDGVPLEELVAKRWGSMEKLNALLKTAERSTRPPSFNKSSCGWRKSENDHSNQKPHDTMNVDQKNDVIGEANEKQVQRESSHIKKAIKVASSSSNGSSSDEDDTNVVMKPLSEKEKNEINAKVLRAELMGDDEMAKELKSILENGKPCVQKKSIEKKVELVKKKNQNESDSLESDCEEVVLTRADKHGNLYPIKLKTDIEVLDQKRKRKKKKMTDTHDIDGKRVRYFEDDDDMELKTMVEQERLTSTADQQVMLARLASKHLGHSQGDDYTLDDMFVTASATKGTTLQEEKRVKEKASHEHRRREELASSCRFCFGNPRVAKHLIIAIGIKTYLALPLSASLTGGHCIIIPMNHVCGQTYLDEDVTQEVKVFKKGLTRMFADRGEDAIFLETCKHLNRQPHCIVECIPVPKEVADMAPIYFKKAITEVGSEWRENRKIVDIKADGGVAKAIPKGLPYFAVEFGLDGGFAHVIEEEESFPFYFGKEIIGVMLDLEPRSWRNPPKESFEQHKRKVIKFADAWKPYDWTYKLNEHP